VWGFENDSIISQFQLKFYKYILKLKISTPSYLGELGAFPVENDITCRMLNFWSKLVNGKNDKICGFFCTALCIIFMKRVFYIVSGLRK
jgi:hypothetical protein